MNNKEVEKIKTILVRYLNKKTFTGCACAGYILEDDKYKGFDLYLGKVDDTINSKGVTQDIYFDTASLTKPLLTVLSILALINDGKIYFNEKLQSLLPFPIPEEKKNITLKQLLNHTSGLPAHKKYYEKIVKNKKENDKNELTKWILKEQLETAPGENYLYSDLDYMLLGRIVEYKTNDTLQNYWLKKITDPLGISEMFHFSGHSQQKSKKVFVSTGNCPWSHEQLKGKANDDNCRATGRYMGHAGLFSTLKGTFFLCNTLLLSALDEKNHPSFKNEDLLYLLKKRKKKHWAYGFDVPTGKNPSSGSYFSGRTIGHLGYTGTSFWIDLQKKIIIVLFTNRTFYGEDNNNIRLMRPEVHNKAMQILMAK